MATQPQFEVSFYFILTAFLAKIDPIFELSVFYLVGRVFKTKEKSSFNWTNLKKKTWFNAN